MTQTEVSNSPEMPAPTMMTEEREGESINMFREHNRQKERKKERTLFVFRFGGSS